MESEQANMTPRENKDSPGDPQAELDLPPEYCHYRDGGCEFADSCLTKLLLPQLLQHRL
jgi:hypothetical protein